MNYKIIGKYIRELNFNIPNPKTFFLLTKDITNYKINIDIRSNQVKQNIVEVLTSLTLSPIKNDFEKIDTKIVYATIIELPEKKIEKKDLEKIVLIDVPSEIYQELRKIFVSLFESSGFKDIQISQYVDFEKLYSTKKVQ
tara:strand:+ start:73 stop:492 length:420 start_codon:yes stop_codon:yes gene_type:complete